MSMVWISIQLTPEQLSEARRKAGLVVLTDEQASSVRGQLNARAKGVSCTCGQCATCKARERKRLQRSRG